MVVVLLPSLLAAQAGGKARFEVDAATVGDALRRLPVADLLIDERGELRRLVNVYVDGEDARRLSGLDTTVDGAKEIRVIAAVAGGANGTTSRSSEPGSRRNGSGPARRSTRRRPPSAPSG